MSKEPVSDQPAFLLSKNLLPEAEFFFGQRLAEKVIQQIQELCLANFRGVSPLPVQILVGFAVDPKTLPVKIRFQLLQRIKEVVGINGVLAIFHVVVVALTSFHFLYLHFRLSFFV